VLVPSNGLDTQILTDDDTALLVKVDRRDSNQLQAIPPLSASHRWGTQTTTTEPTQEEEGGDEDGDHPDNSSDFGSLKEYHGGKTISYSNPVDALTATWDSLHLYRFNADFNANEIQDVSAPPPPLPHLLACSSSSSRPPPSPPPQH
jgi:hypothetical protein